MIKRSTNGLEITAGKLESIANAVSKVPGGSKLSSSIQKISEDAKFAEEAQKSLNDTVAKAVKNDYRNTSDSFTEPIRSPVKLESYKQSNNAKPEMAALDRTANPTFDNTKIKEALAEINEFINTLTPNFENMSMTA